MQIKTIHIDSFGGVRDLTLELKQGLNILEGKNESGKSSVAMFIKFIFYGLSGRGVDGKMSERSRYVNWESGSAAGYIILEKNGITYKISRELYVSDDATRERVNITDTETGEKLFKGECPGVALLGMPEQMFYNSVFVRQLSDASIDGNGMSEAIENILYSGDEEVSTRRALEKLEKSRKSLLHKNGNGGRIYELRREIARLEASLSEAVANNAEIMQNEYLVADSARLIASREKHAEELEEILECHDKLARLASLEELEKQEAEIRRLKAMLDSFPSRTELEGACDEMRNVSSKRREAELKLKTVRINLATLNKTLPPMVSEEEKAEDKLDINTAAKALGKRKSCFGISVALFVLSVICGAGVFFLLAVDKSLAIIAGGAAAVMLAVATVLLCISITSLKKYNAILDKWRARTIEEMVHMAEEKVEKALRLRGEGSEYETLMRNEEETDRERERLLCEQRNLSARFTPEEPDTDTMTEKALSRATATLREMAAVTREYDTAMGKLSAMGERTAEERVKIRLDAAAALETEAGKTAQKLTHAEYEKTVRDKGFFRSSTDAQKRRHQSLEKELSALIAVAVSPADISMKINEAKAELEELSAKYNAVALAIDTITKASESLRASLLPRIVGEAGVLMGAFTAGKYTGLGVDRNFDMSYNHGGYQREADFMSAGTRDAAYLSVRNALMKVLFPGNAPFAVYDESFSRIDEERLKRLLDVLSTAGDEGTQSLVFTCRSLEGHLTGENIPIIKL
ncbi:MAG: AAA family ATPase [Clostridia bacterium]|nr:AAA family ATPase [Clostridia bacterium]